MLIFLGKVRLGQRETEEKVAAPQDSNINLLLAEIKSQPRIKELEEEIKILKEKLNEQKR